MAGIIWYVKDRGRCKVRNLFEARDKNDIGYTDDPLKSEGFRRGTAFNYEAFGRLWHCGQSEHWKIGKTDLDRACRSGRIIPKKTSLRFRKYHHDFPVKEFSSIWPGFGGAADIYIVQTNTRVVERCLLMTTDPGDLILDPTCGSGTTAYVTEQWGRRWITIDTSRVALALARSRLMGARYSYYLLADSREGQLSSTLAIQAG
jgi:adenine-specific DNA-methyltransferase